MVARLNAWDKVFQPKKAKWPRPQDSVGHFYRTMGDLECWEATNLARDAFCGIAVEIKEYLEKYSDPVSDEVTWTMYMIGRTKETSEPTIMFCGRDDKCRKQVRKTVKESGILKRHPGVRLGDASRPPDFDQLVQLGVSYHDLSFEPSELFDLDDSDLSLHSQTVVFGDEHGGPFGKRLLIPIHDGDRDLVSVRVATGGGILRAGSRHFYLTAGHVFEDREKLVNSDALDEIDEFSFDVSEEEQSDDDSQFFETTSRGSLSPDIDESISSDGTAASIDIHSKSSTSSKEPEISSATSEEQNAISRPDSAALEKLLDGLMIVGRPLTRPIDSSGSVDHEGALDYSLIELNQKFLATFEMSSIIPAPPLPLTVSGNIMTKPANQSVLSVTTSAGLIRGILSGTSTYQLMAGARNTRELWTVKFQSTLRDGDCGSWVVNEDHGDLVGHIVAGNPGTGAAYIVPACNVFADAKTKYGLDLEPVLFPPANLNSTEKIQPHSAVDNQASDRNQSSSHTTISGGKSESQQINLVSTLFDPLFDFDNSDQDTASSNSHPSSVDLEQLSVDDSDALLSSMSQDSVHLRKFSNSEPAESGHNMVSSHTSSRHVPPYQIWLEEVPVVGLATTPRRAASPDSYLESPAKIAPETRKEPGNTAASQLPEGAKKFPAYSNSPSNLVNLGEAPPKFLFGRRSHRTSHTSRSEVGPRSLTLNPAPPPPPPPGSSVSSRRSHKSERERKRDRSGSGGSSGRERERERERRSHKSSVTESYTSARTRHSSSTIKAPPEVPVPPPAACFVSTSTVRKVPRSHVSHASERQRDIEFEREKQMDREREGREWERERMVPLPESVVSARQRPLPLPMSLVGDRGDRGGGGYEYEASVPPSDSVSSVGVKRERERLRDRMRERGLVGRWDS